MIPIIPLPYKILAAVLAVILTVGGCFFYGYSKGIEKSDMVIAQYEADAAKKIAALERKNSEIKERVVTQYVDRVRTIREKEYVYRDRAAQNVPAQEYLSNGWVYLHDASATSTEADGDLSSDPKPSDVMDNRALAVVVSNYAICSQNSEQLRNLQEWINKTKEEVERQ